MPAHRQSVPLLLRLIVVCYQQIFMRTIQNPPFFPGIQTDDLTKHPCLDDHPVSFDPMDIEEDDVQESEEMQEDDPDYEPLEDDEEEEDDVDDEAEQEVEDGWMDGWCLTALQEVEEEDNQHDGDAPLHKQKNFIVFLSCLQSLFLWLRLV